MLGRWFAKKVPKPETQLLVARLNARLQPLDRGDFFEDPLDVALRESSRGEVSGGGTMQFASGEIEFCDIEIRVADRSSANVELVVGKLERLGAPKGSMLLIEGDRKEIPFGREEGLAVYLNGTDLPPETYRDCDSNHVYTEFERLLGDEGRVLSHWQGPTETALYLRPHESAVHDSIDAWTDEFRPSFYSCRDHGDEHETSSMLSRAAAWRRSPA